MIMATRLSQSESIKDHGVLGDMWARLRGGRAAWPLLVALAGLLIATAVFGVSCAPVGAPGTDTLATTAMGGPATPGGAGVVPTPAQIAGVVSAVRPVHTTGEAYDILHSFGVAGSPARIADEFTTVCAELDGTTSTAHRVWLNLEAPYGHNNGSVLAEAVDAYCPRYLASVATMAKTLGR
jgi:hypothetical protein